MKWTCSADGDCCELFAKFAVGSLECPMFTDERNCKCYATRPKVCRVDSFEVDGLDKDEYLIARCQFIHMLKRWKDEVGESSSSRYIIEKIAGSGLR
jgi:Fe-S-cluster containining protein